MHGIAGIVLIAAFCMCIASCSACPIDDRQYTSFHIVNISSDGNCSPIANATVEIQQIRDPDFDSYLREVFGIQPMHSKIDLNTTSMVTDANGTIVVAVHPATKYMITASNTSFLIYPVSYDYWLDVIRP